MTAARDRADRKGSTPIQIGSTKLSTDGSDNLSVTNASGTPKKLIASEIEIGDSSNKVIIKKGSDNKVAFQTQASGGSAQDSDAGGGGVTVYATISAMTSASGSAGDQALVTANSGLYVHNGGGWYKVATINTSPTISSPSTGANIALSTSGVATSIEITAADVDEGTTLQYSYAVTTGSLTNIASVTSSATSNGTYTSLAASTNTTNRFFKVTPVTSPTTGGSVSLTFSASDGISAATTVQNFDLSFIPEGSTTFDGNGDALTIGASSDFQMETGDFTIEAWVYSTSYSNSPYILDLRASGGSPTSQPAPLIYINSSNNINYYVNGSAQISTSYSSYQNKWTHIAVIKNSGITTLFLDGVSKGTYSDSVNYNQSNSSAIIGMRSGYNSQSLNGYISNLRIVKGSAAYTINTASGGSTSFDGNGDALTVAASADFAFGTGDFTIEAWVYSTTYANFPYIFDGRTNTGSSSNAPALYIHSNNNINYYVAGSNQISTSYSSYHNKFTHIAIVRNSGTTTLYLDGVSKGTWSDSTNYTDQGPFVIGRHGNSSNATYCLNGYMSNFRIVKGTAVYTSAFTPSNTALTAITNTKLLTCQNSTGTITDASSSSHSITASGNAAASTQQPFSDYFTVPTSPLTAITNTILLTSQENTGTIIDRSSNNFTITVVGNAAANSLNPF